MKLSAWELARGALLAERLANGKWETKGFIRDIIILIGLFISLVAIFIMLMLLPAMASPMQMLPNPKITITKPMTGPAGPVTPKSPRQVQNISVEVGKTKDYERLTFPSSHRVQAQLINRGGGRFAVKFIRPVTLDVSKVMVNGPEALRDIWIDEDGDHTTIELRIDRGHAVHGFHFGNHFIVEITNHVQAGFVTQKSVEMDLSDIASEELADANLTDGDLEDQYRRYLRLH